MRNKRSRGSLALSLSCARFPFPPISSQILHFLRTRFPGSRKMCYRYPAFVEREHLLHSLPIAVLFAKSPEISPSVHPGNLVVSINVRCRTGLWNLTPKDVAVRVVNKPARIFFHFEFTFKLPSLLTFDKTGSLRMSRADISQPSHPL